MLELNEKTKLKNDRDYLTELDGNNSLFNIKFNARIKWLTAYRESVEGEYPPTEESVSALLEFSKHAKINPEAIALGPDGECCIIYNGRDMEFLNKNEIYYNKKFHTLDELIRIINSNEN